MYQDRLRSMRWHTTSSEFRIMDGPAADMVTTTSLGIQWTMSEVCSGQVEWGTSAGSLTSATTEQAISGGYSTHFQTITGLNEATTYWYRIKSVSASGTTVYSEVLSDTTSGTVPLPTGLGPRYSEYTGVAGGTFPTFPSGADVVYAPTSILSASDKGLALGQWITAQADGKTLVFDSSGGGTAYGAGTEYVISDNVPITPGSGVLKSNQTLWMYNTRIRSTNRTGVNRTASYTSKGACILYFFDGGHENLTILGGTLQGANANAGTYACRALGTEAGHGIMITNYRNLIIRDVRIEQTMGDGLNLNQGDVQSARWDVGWLYPSGFEFGWSLVDGTGRQGLVPNQCAPSVTLPGFWVHHSEVKDTALSCVDYEDNILTPSPYRYIRGGLIEDNVFDKWTWHIVYTATPPTGNFHTWALQFSSDQTEVDTVDDWVVQRNRFKFGHAGWGNPVAEVAIFGSVINGGAGCGGVHVGAVPPPWHDLTRSAYKTNFSFIDNVFELQPDQRNGYALHFREVAGLTVTGNDFQGLDVRALDCTSVTFSGNSTGSSLVTT